MSSRFGLSCWLAVSLTVAASAQPNIAQCFKVYDLLKMDQDHYWANWANACPYTIDSVYVMVRFSDRSRTRLGNGVWALHFVTPGTHQVTRFTAPRGVPEFEFVQLHKITADSLEALLGEPADRIPRVSAEAQRTGDPGPWQVASGTKAQEVAVARMPAEAGPHLVADASPRVDAGPRLVGDAGPAVFAAMSTAAVGARVDSVQAESAEEHHRRGRELIQKGDYPAAIDELSRAIQAQPDWSMVYNARGFAYYLEHDYRRAIADLNEAIRLNPRYVNAYQNRRLSRKAAGDARGSVADSKKIRALLATQ
jgi:tetratricopeptide (TPR) repeat protein